MFFQRILRCGILLVGTLITGENTSWNFLPLSLKQPVNLYSLKPVS
jgi:hypothetical protein